MKTDLVQAANAGDAEAAMELIHRHESEAIANSSTGTGRARLWLCPPKRRLYPTLPRSVAQVDDGLRKLFTQLAAGKADWPLFLYGSVGTGKTAAALCFADCVQNATYTTVQGLCDDVMAGKAIETEDATVNYRLHLDDPPHDPSIRQSVSILDELGTRSKIGDLEYSAIKRFADHREFEHRNVVVYVSNLTPEQLREVYDERIASRVLRGTWFHLAGPDRRFQG